MKSIRFLSIAALLATVTVCAPPAYAEPAETHPSAIEVVNADMATPMLDGVFYKAPTDVSFEASDIDFKPASVSVALAVALTRSADVIDQTLASLHVHQVEDPVAIGPPVLNAQTPRLNPWFVLSPPTAEPKAAHAVSTLARGPPGA